MKTETALLSAPFTLASCLINAQPLLAHSPAADDNSLIGCTSHDLTDDWSLASTHFVDSQYTFWHSFGCVLLLNQMFCKQCTIRQYHSDLSVQSALEIRVRNLVYTQSCTRFSRRIRKVSTLYSAKSTDGDMLLTERTHTIRFTYSRSACA